jgi:predicted nucleotidyltransferase
MTQPSAEHTGFPIAGDALELLGISPAASRMFRYFLVRPDARPHARELQRLLRLGGASLERELERMLALGALRRREEGRRVVYEAIHDSPIWKALRVLAVGSADPVPFVEAALADVPGVRAAFIFGSTAEGTQKQHSDIDLFVLEDAELDRNRLLRQLAEVELLLEREVNPVRYTPQTLAERLGDPDHPAWQFIRNVLTGPKRWIAGAASSIAPLATAAGLRIPDLMASVT